MTIRENGTENEGKGEGRNARRTTVMDVAMISVFMAWFIVLFLTYAYRIPPIERIIGSYADIFLFISILVSSFFLGRLFTGVSVRDGWRFSMLSELHPITVGIGLWMLSLISFLFAITGLIQKWSAISLILIILVLSLLFLRFSGSKAKAAGANSVPQPAAQQNVSDQHVRERPSTFEMVLAGLLWFLVILAFSFFLRPPVHYDSLEYHLSVPAEMIKNNALLYFPHDVHSNFPLYGEMLYLISLLISGWKLANLVNFIFFPLLIASLYVFVRNSSGRPAALIAAAIFASTYTVLGIATHPLVDLEFAFFTLGSFIVLILWLQEGKEKYLHLSALLTGIALGIKYTAFIFTIPLNLLFLAIFAFIRKDRLYPSFIKVMLYLVIVIAVASPWLIRNFINTGDPVFPTASRYLGHGSWTEEQGKLLKKAANASPLDMGEIAKFPYRMSFSSKDFGSFSWVGPVYLIFLPLIFLYRKERIDYILILYSMLYFLLWAFSFNMMRFAVPLMGALSILAGRAVQKYIFVQKSHFLKQVVLLSVVCAVVFNITYFVARETDTADGLKSVFGNVTEGDFLAEQLSYYGAIEFYNGIAGEDSRILFIGETRTFYCEGRAVWSSAYDENPIVPIVKKSSSRAEIEKNLRAQGFTHILYSPFEMIRLNRNYRAYDLSEEELKRFIDFLKEGTTPLFADRNVYILQIGSSGEGE